MNPVIFQYSSLIVYTYGFSLCVGSLVSTFLLWRRAKRLGYSTESIFDVALLSGLSALIFSRVFYVLGHWEEFQGSLLRILLVTYFPGLDGIGAILGVVVMICLFTFIKKWRPLEVFDSAFYGLGLGMVVVMLGTFFSGDLPGIITSSWPSVLFPGLEGARHPVALYWMLAGVIYSALVFLADWRFPRTGVITLFFLIYFGALVFILTPVTDFVAVWLGIGMPYYFAGIMIFLGALLGLLVFKRK